MKTTTKTSSNDERQQRIPTQNIIFKTQSENAQDAITNESPHATEDMKKFYKVLFNKADVPRNSTLKNMQDSMKDG